MVTNPKDWAGKQKTESIILPSGAVVQVKTSKMRYIMASNLLPYDLLIRVQSNKADSPEDRGELMKAAQRLFELIAKIVVEPKIIITGEPGEDEISILDIPDEDISYLRGYILGTEEAKATESFRSGSAGTVA